MLSRFNDRMRHAVADKFPFSVPCIFVQPKCNAFSVPKSMHMHTHHRWLFVCVCVCACLCSPICINRWTHLEPVSKRDYPLKFTMRWKWNATANRCINCAYGNRHTQINIECTRVVIIHGENRLLTEHWRAAHSHRDETKISFAKQWRNEKHSRKYGRNFRF